MAWQSSEREVAGGKTSVGEDRRVHPGEEVGDAGVHIRQILQHACSGSRYSIISVENMRASVFEVNLNVGNLGKSVASDALQDVDTTLFNGERSPTVSLAGN